VIDRQGLERLAEVVQALDLLVICDEIYAEILYNDVDYVSFASCVGMRERTIVVGGFSKAFAMTGWRLGFAAGPEPAIRAMVRVHQYAMLCAPVMAQMAALEALEAGLDDVSRMVAEYDRRRRLIVRGLADLGLATTNPDGAFYVFPSIVTTNQTSEAFAESLLRHARVAVVPGSVFGAAGEGFVRVSYATGLSQIERALERMNQYLRAGG
jgi:aminotransferase